MLSHGDSSATANVLLRYASWSLRGYAGRAWQVYVEIQNSRSITQLIAVKRQLNNPPVRGIVLVENSSPAMKRLGPGWKEMEHGVWYKIFH